MDHEKKHTDGREGFKSLGSGKKVPEPCASSELGAHASCQFLPPETETQKHTAIGKFHISSFRMMKNSCQIKLYLVDQCGKVKTQKYKTHGANTEDGRLLKCFCCTAMFFRPRFSELSTKPRFSELFPPSQSNFLPKIFGQNSFSRFFESIFFFFVKNCFWFTLGQAPNLFSC